MEESLEAKTLTSLIGQQKKENFGDITPTPLDRPTNERNFWGYNTNTP